MKNILVRSPNWIGDQILSYPFFHYLRSAYPKARIAAVCVPWVESLQFRNLVDEVIVLPKPKDSGFMSKLQLLEEGAKAIRACGPWDLGLILPNSFSSAWLFFRGGVSLRRGYSTDARGFLLQQGIRWPASPGHRAQAYLELLPEQARAERPASEFWGVPAQGELDEDVPGVIDTFDAAAAWPDVKPLVPPKENYWVMAPGSIAESRRWSAESFALLARTVAHETGWTGVVVGGPRETKIAESLCSDPSLKLLDLTARGAVASFSRVFSGAKFTVSNDSGLAHMAALCGSPLQVVWGAGDPKRTRPIGKKKIQMIFTPIECWPCERNFCDLPQERKFSCLRGIEASSVWKEIQDGLRP